MSEYISSNPTLYIGDFCTVTIDDDYNVWCFGYNEHGKSGQDLEYKDVFPPKKIDMLNNIQYIACGTDHTLCCNFDGVVYSFGDNTFGQLGLKKGYKTISYSYVPRQIKLPSIIQIASGDLFSICLSDKGDLWSFGHNHFGQLGIGKNSIQSLIYRKDSATPLKIKSISNVEHIECGGSFCFCKTASNKVFSWGYNKYGQLAQGHYKHLTFPHECINIPDDFISIKVSRYSVFFLTSDGIVYSCGNNNYYQIGHPNNRNFPTLKPIESLPFIKKISCGFNHTLCIDIDNNLWIFGFNRYGQLGLGHTEYTKSPIKHESFDNVIDMSYGSDSTYIKTADNKIYVFGGNSHAQLGIKTNENKLVYPVQVFINNENIWKTNIQNNRAKSARK